MRIQLISVHDEINVAAVAQDLQDDGVVVLLTSRFQARAVAKEISKTLDVAEESEFYLTHLSFEVDDRGWEHCLMYSKVAEHEPDALKDMTIESVRAWVAAGEPKRYVHRYRYGV